MDYLATMKQQPLPTLTQPILGMRKLRKAVGGKHRLDALDHRGKWEDKLDPILGCVLVAALEAQDTPTRRVAQSIGYYAREGKLEERLPIRRLPAHKVLELIVAISPHATSLDKAKRQVSRWAVDAYRQHQAELEEHHAAYLRKMQEFDAARQLAGKPPLSEVLAAC